MHRLFSVLLLCAACNTPTSAPPAGGDLQVQVVRLEHAQAANISKVLEETLASRPAMSGDMKVAVQPDQNAVILSGTNEQIRQALELVARLDTRPGR